jgi:hypothetical protein
MSGLNPSTNRRISFPRVNDHFLIMVCVFSIFFVWNFMSSTDFDFWWHITAGEQIVNTHTIPTVDQWTYTIAGQPWIAHEWLAEIVMYLLYSSLGFGAITMLFSLVGTAAYVLLYFLLRKIGINGTIALLVIIWSHVMQPFAVGSRPATFTVLFFAVFVFILYRYKERQASPLWLLPILMVVWSNLHAGYVAGLLLLAAITVGEWVNGKLGHSIASIRPLVFASVASVLAMLINPNGFNVILYPLSKVGGNASMSIITEWASNDFHNWWNWLFAAMVLALVFIGRDRFDCTEFLIIFGFALLALYSRRHVPICTIAVMPFLAQRIKDKIPWMRGNNSIPRVSYTALSLVAPIVILVVGLNLPTFKQGFSVGTSIHTPIPQGAVEYLIKNRPEGRLFTSYNWGGYLINKAPEYPVFIDSRGDCFPDQVVNDFATMYYVTSGWKNALQKWDIGIVLIEQQSPLGAVLRHDADWQLAYEGPTDLLYLRTDNNHQSTNHSN